MELSEVLQSEHYSRKLCHLFAEKFFEEDRDTEPGWHCMEKIAVAKADQNLGVIEAHCESPLEKIFFRDLQLNFLKNSPLSLRFMPPADGDIEEAIRVHTSFSESAYRNPSTNRGEGSRFETEFILGFYHNFHIALQPSFKGFYPNGKSIRADAMVWIPSNPRCRVIIECDGFEWHKGQKSFVNDRLRDRRFTDKGYTVRRYSGPEVFADPIAPAYDLFEYLVGNFVYGEELREKWEGDMAISA